MSDPDPLAPPDEAMHRFFVRDLVFDALIGVYEREHVTPQRIRLSLDLAVSDPAFDIATTIENARAVALAGHVTLLETLVERIAARCLADTRVRVARVRVDKLDIFPDAVVGIEIVRRNH